MITYKEIITVKLDGKPIGTIHTNPGGVFYLPKGYKYDAGITKVYPTLSLCKQALEAD